MKPSVRQRPAHTARGGDRLWSHAAHASALRCWEFIGPEMEAILDAFYAGIHQSDQRDLLRRVDLDRLRARQIAHWRALFTSPRLTGAPTRLIRMHLRHREIGLSSTDYVRGYFMLLGRFHQAVMRKASSLDEAIELVQTVDAIILTDVSLALRIYHEVIAIE